MTGGKGNSAAQTALCHCTFLQIHKIKGDTCPPSPSPLVSTPIKLIGSYKSRSLVYDTSTAFILAAMHIERAVEPHDIFSDGTN